MAEQQFREGINSKLNGSDTIAPQLAHIYFYQFPGCSHQWPSSMTLSTAPAASVAAPLRP